jgi:hypothetical protein
MGNLVAHRCPQFVNVCMRCIDANLRVHDDRVEDGALEADGISQGDVFRRQWMLAPGFTKPLEECFITRIDEYQFYRKTLRLQGIETRR